MAWLQRFQQLSVSRRFPYGQRLTGLALAIAAIAAAPAVAQAQSLLEESGSLAPMEARYTFTGQAGQTVTVRLNSKDFDPVLLLLGPDGAELAMNDDSERTLNSRVVTTLPQGGTYTIVARSFSGGGGDFKVSVTPATALDQDLFRIETLFYEGSMDSVLGELDRAIANHPNSPTLYWYRADAHLSLEQQDKALEDYRRAQALFEQAGDTDNAATIADMINSFSQGNGGYEGMEGHEGM
ncbi:MAG: hypothetical protein Fur0042_05190 [Cyanophyceae cyanobacterium]